MTPNRGVHEDFYDRCEDTMTDAANIEKQSAHAEDDHGWVHVAPAPILIGTFAALMVLTVLTVAVTFVDLGNFNLFLAMVIATVKATLVALFFMHLVWDRSFCSIVFLGALVFVGLFIGVVLLDTIEYQPDIKKFQQEQMLSE
jgi:cytochrome c oxidase subunit IV